MPDYVFLESRLLHLKNKRNAVIKSLTNYGTAMPKKHLIYKMQELLPSIEDAIKKIETDHEIYGICENCGNEIPKNRLSIFPEAKFCTECQKMEEKQKNVQ